MKYSSFIQSVLLLRMTKRLITDFFDTNTGVRNKVICKSISTASKVDLEPELPKDEQKIKDSVQNETFRSMLGDEWSEVLDSEIQKGYFQALWTKVANERKVKKVYPPADLVFNAFKLTPLSKIKVVIVGQDPYHQPRQAMGLSFSVPRGVLLPPSLRNIFAEIGTTSRHGDLTSWANQGVFLLNSILTVVDSQPLAHKFYGWDAFTNCVIDIINEKRENVVFLLWGKFAQEKCSKISKSKHCILTCGHPSPLSIKFFKGCDHFKKCNEYLTKTNQTPIDWKLPQ
ncbi:uracil DNA glycosylase, putative [Theileria equi strain WA]|uniref:Uracil-DNA glycosylase n=1 Tax=Theileria equi strain WA TaxID=1537102 RepID=L0AUF9_THEEQ|nr:uracil DNA glycosylase, putative [Theileria equi strain WA]AFZ79267.1 uracil DNA glycosylase, putative [Theileria equi strain WA]|eukprot:XP_004828933.1 uracil DNA glycosylase, putative [Theileria equi strain WA]